LSPGFLNMLRKHITNAKNQISTPWG
jgi:hypothetical protein